MSGFMPTSASFDWRNLVAPEGTRRLAVLAGAGISLKSPANLLDGSTFMRHVLTRMVPSDVDVEQALAVLRLPEATLRRPGESLRFEMLMHALVEKNLDPELHVLDCLDKCEHPNSNHFALAELIHEGALVTTTNFDRLIELAWHRLFPDQALQVAAFDSDFPRTSEEAEDGPTLWKLHGSLSVGTRDTRRSVQATMVAALSRTLSSRKAAFLESVLRSRDLLIVGYSGSDDLDLVPIIGDTRSDRQLTWIHHSTEHRRVVDATQALAATTAKFECDAVGRDRVWFFTTPDGKAIRDPTRMLCATADTTEVVANLSATMPSGGRYPIDEHGFAFGSGYPAEVDRYFDEWESSLGGGAPERYDLLAALHSCRQFRPQSKAIIDYAERRARELRRTSLDPRHVLMTLIEEFNDGEPVESVRSRLDALSPALPASTLGSAQRLGACIAWRTTGAKAGEDAFSAAAATDRGFGNPGAELNTLLTWRSFAGFAPWGDGVPPDVSRRIDELSHDFGFLPAIWQQELLRHAHFIDEHGDYVTLGRRLLRMQRHSIDVGDVRGEAIAALQLGRIYLLDQQPGLAMEEFLRVRELQRALGDERLASEAASFIQGTAALVNHGYVDRMLPLIRASLWGGRDQP